jgi:hypothetical protein
MALESLMATLPSAVRGTFFAFIVVDYTLAEIKKNEKDII